MKLIELNIKGVKCDNRACDWRDDDAEFEPKKWLNAPCPKCGANLFTDEAYEQLKTTIGIIDRINNLVGPCQNGQRELFALTHNDKGLINGVKYIGPKDGEG